MEKIPYSSGVGSVMYSMVHSRPDLNHPLSVGSRFISDPGKEHYEAFRMGSKVYQRYS